MSFLLIILSIMFFSVHQKYFLLATLFVLLGFVAPILAVEIEVSADRNPINLNESFQLIFSAHDTPDADPDFSPLAKDFEILNQSQQQSTEIINWKRTKTVKWILTLIPKHSGNLVIPVINFGQDNSPFLALIVNDAVHSTRRQDALFLQVSVDKLKPYVQEQVIYTLKLFRKVNISQAQLTDPTLADAVVEKLGEDKKYRSQYQGENYIVIERKYAIFPQKSGSLDIKPLTLIADIMTTNQPQFNGFFNRQSTRTQRVESEAIHLDVQSVPAEMKGVVWLPAEQVYLEEKWPAKTAEIKVGEPVTRTVTLLAKGVTASALPEINTHKMPTHLKAYPDQPVIKEQGKADGVIAFREEKVALIPSKAGTYILPAIEIPWWNTKTKQQEVARLAERHIVAIATAVTDMPVMSPPTPIDTPELQSLAEEKTESPMRGWVEDQRWFWLALFFASAWLITLIYFLMRGSVKSKNNTSKKPVVTTLGTVEKQLKQACMENDTTLAKEALLRWGGLLFQKNSLASIAAQCDDGLQQEILVLNTVLYSGKAKAWEGARLWAAFKQEGAHRQAESSDTEPLEPLFKL